MKRLLLCLLFSPAIFAEPSPNRIEQLMSMDLEQLLTIEVATGTPKELSQVPAVVSVLTEQDIKATGARSIHEVLERVVGLHVSRSELLLHPTYSMRGIQTDMTPHVLLLMDGDEINLMSVSSYPMAFNYPVSAIDRVEIIRGPSSAIYGADAFSGVINIITKRAEEANYKEIGLTAGSFGSTEAWFNTSYKNGELKAFFAANRELTDGDNDRETPYGPLNTKRRQSNLHLNLDYKEWSSSIWYYKTHQYLGTGAGIHADPDDNLQAKGFKTALSYNTEISAELELEAKLSHWNYTARPFYRLFPVGTWPVGDDGNVLLPPFKPVEFPNGVIGIPTTGNESTRLRGLAIYSPSESHRIRAEIGYAKTDLQARELKNFGPGVLDTENFKQVSDELVDVTGTDYIYSPDYTRELNFVSLQDEWRVSNVLELTVGIRLDDYNDFGSTTNPRFAAVWQATDSLTTKVLYGSAFRAPTVAERAFINNPITIGNPDIKPETIDTYELVFNQKFSEQFNAAMNLYYYQAKDLIVQDINFVYQNQGQQDGKGIELEFNWQPNADWSVYSNFSYNDSEDPILKADKAWVARTMVDLDLRYSISEQWQASLQSHWIADRKRQTNDTREPIDDYVKTDINFTYQSPNGDWLAQLKIDNLFDQDIREPAPNSALFALGLGFPEDIPMAGRALYVTATYSF